MKKPPTRPHGDSAEGVTVLVRRFPFEIDRLTFKCFAESAGNFDDFTGYVVRRVVVP
jgi:hypothetical protein